MARARDLCVYWFVYMFVCLLSEKYFRRKLRTFLTLHGEEKVAPERLDSLLISRLRLLTHYTR